MPKRPYPRWRRRHDAILLCILDYPFATQKEIARMTRYTCSQVSRIMSSPDFALRYEEMMREYAFQARRDYLARRHAA